MYSGWEVCNTLKLNEKCVRVRRYNEGKYENCFHEHIPAHRIGQDEMFSALKCLIMHYEKWSPN